MKLDMSPVPEAYLVPLAPSYEADTPTVRTGRGCVCPGCVFPPEQVTLSLPAAPRSIGVKAGAAEPWEKVLPLLVGWVNDLLVIMINLSCG